MTAAYRIAKPGLEALKGKWKLDLLYGLSGGCARWSALTHCIPEAAPNVLTRQLRHLEKDGLVLRRITSAHPPQIIEYTLSEKGRQYTPLLEELYVWSERYGSGAALSGFEVSQRVISSQWMLQILPLVPSPLRFGQIHEALGDISRGVLAAQLQELREMGLIYQTRYDCFPPRVEYSLSEKGKALMEILTEQQPVAGKKNA